jgi:DNA-binding LacI/PurR family transcriptional regulator
MMDINSKRVTLDDVAQQAGVSSQTVSRVVNRHPYVAEATRRRVLDVIQQLDYRPNRAARQLATRRSGILGIVTSAIYHYGPSQMVNHVEHTAKARGYGVSLSIVESMELAEIRTAIDYLGDRLVDGLILITPTTGVTYTELTQVCGGVPFVQLDTDLGAQVPSIVIDQHYGSRIATQYLIDRGHRDVSAISGPLNWHGAQARHVSWRETLLAAGLTPGMVVEGDWTAASGYQAARQILDAKAHFTALEAANDQMALGAIRALHEQGLCVPEDVSIIGFDDRPEAAYFDPPLTTVQQNFAAVGEQSVEYLVDMIENPDLPIHQRVLYPQIIERQSTRRWT